MLHPLENERRSSNCIKYTKDFRENFKSTFQNDISSSLPFLFITSHILLHVPGAHKSSRKEGLRAQLYAPKCGTQYLSMTQNEIMVKTLLSFNKKYNPKQKCSPARKYIKQEKVANFDLKKKIHTNLFFL